VSNIICHSLIEIRSRMRIAPASSAQRGNEDRDNGEDGDEDGHEFGACGGRDQEGGGHQQPEIKDGSRTESSRGNGPRRKGQKRFCPRRQRSLTRTTTTTLPRRPA